jgi:hypothetical protein
VPNQEYRETDEAGKKNSGAGCAVDGMFVADPQPKPVPAKRKQQTCRCSQRAQGTRECAGCRRQIDGRAEWSGYISNREFVSGALEFASRVVASTPNPMTCA